MRARTKCCGRHRGVLASNPDFARLWLGESVSAIGSQVTMLALPLLAVNMFGATAGQMGLLGAAQTIPFLVLALPAGVWIDRRRKRPILIAANAARAVLLGLIPLLAGLGVLNFTRLLVIALGVGSCTVLFEVAYQSYLPHLVDRADLVDANSKLAASTSIAEIGGPGLGGVLVGALTAPVAIAVDAVTFLFSATNLARIRRTEFDADLHADDASLGSQLREGFHETFANRYLLAFAGEAATYNVAWSAIDAILVLWAVRDLGLAAATLGLLLSIGSVGSLLGALLTGAFARRVGVGRALWISAVLSNLGVLLIPLAGGSPVMVIAVLGVAFCVRGLGATATNVHTYAIRQAVTPARLMGRTTAVYRLLTHGFIPIGALTGGLLGDTLGLRPALAIAALALFPSWVWLYFSPARSLGEIPALHER